MSIEWDRLVDVHERRKKLALEAMLAERRAAEHSRAQAQREHAEWQQLVAAKATHWQAARGVFTSGGFNVAQLCDAAAWSGALDAAIAQQGQVVQQAQAASDERERALDASRAALRTAAGHVEKAARMQQRDLTERQRVSDARVEAVAEEFAATRWSARRTV